MRESESKKKTDLLEFFFFSASPSLCVTGGAAATQNTHALCHTRFACARRHKPERACVPVCLGRRGAWWEREKIGGGTPQTPPGGEDTDKKEEGEPGA